LPTNCGQSSLHSSSVDLRQSGDESTDFAFERWRWWYHVGVTTTCNLGACLARQRPCLKGSCARAGNQLLLRLGPMGTPRGSARQSCRNLSNLAINRYGFACCPGPNPGGLAPAPRQRPISARSTRSRSRCPPRRARNVRDVFASWPRTSQRALNR
jgi:hypothetical protein